MTCPTQPTPAVWLHELDATPTLDQQPCPGALDCEHCLDELRLTLEPLGAVWPGIPDAVDTTNGDTMTSDADHAVLDAAWHRAFDALQAASLEADADHPVAAAYRAASDAVNHAIRSRDFAIFTGQPTT